MSSACRLLTVWKRTKGRKLKEAPCVICTIYIEIEIHPNVPIQRDKTHRVGIPIIRDGYNRGVGDLGTLGGTLGPWGPTWWFCLAFFFWNCFLLYFFLSGEPCIRCRAVKGANISLYGIQANTRDFTISIALIMHFINVLPLIAMLLWIHFMWLAFRNFALVFPYLFFSFGTLKQTSI